MRRQTLLQDHQLKHQIHQANISVHRFEAQYYELLHPEVYSRQEQKRISNRLKTIDKQISSNQKKALDIGAGTGNLTGKLLELGYRVVAIDISPEMCAILKRKFKSHLDRGLRVLNLPVEDLAFVKGEFDLITSYSVLHHLPDYTQSLRTISSFLKRGGVIYIDHEASPYYWQDEPTGLANMVKDLYLHSSPAINGIYFQLIGLRVPTIDYTLSDYWYKKDHPINHKKIEQIFKQEGYQSYQRIDHYLHSTWIPNPLSQLYRLLCQPEMSYWIAKK